ncbi:MAG: chorismate synthase, partial [Myxococcaceae bacterium]
MNTFGELFRLTTFGESHGPAMGAVVDGCPAGVPLEAALLQSALDRRRPGQSGLTSARLEPDRAELLSGVYEGKTLGT